MVAIKKDDEYEEYVDYRLNPEQRKMVDLIVAESMWQELQKSLLRRHLSRGFPAGPITSDEGILDLGADGLPINNQGSGQKDEANIPAKPTGEMMYNDGYRFGGLMN